MKNECKNSFLSSLVILFLFCGSSLAFAADKPKKQELSDTVCAVGEVLKYNGTEWACAADEDSPTTTLDWSNITNRPSGLDDGDDDTDTLSNIPCASGEVIKSDGAGGWTCSVDETGTPSSDTLASLSCENGDVARFNGTSWECSDAVTKLELFQFGKRVFLTSELVSGDLGGLDGADARCQEFATEAGLPGRYRAWLSDFTGSPSTRFTQSSSPYFLLDGTVIAQNWADLTDGEIASPISVFEDGTPFTPSSSLLDSVWSATKEDGTLALAIGPEFLCDNWTSTAVQGFIGSPNASGAPETGQIVSTAGGDVRLGWTRVQAEIIPGTGNFGEATPGCGGARLYCFQQ